MPENIEEKTNEEFEEPEECQACAVGHYPEFYCEPDDVALKHGASESSYLLGFCGALNLLDLSEANIMTLLLNKMTLEYQKEMLRMQIESEERIAEIEAKNPVSNTIIGY